MEQSAFVPPSVTVHVLAIFAAVHVARSAFAAGQLVLVPSSVTEHVFATAETDAPVICAESAVAQLAAVSQFATILIVCGLPPSTVTIKS